MVEICRQDTDGTITDWEIENICESAEDTARRMRETIPQHKQRGDP